jgi:hypothetical protein
LRHLPYIVFQQVLLIKKQKMIQIELYFFDLFAIFCDNMEGNIMEITFFILLIIFCLITLYVVGGIKRNLHFIYNFNRDANPNRLFALDIDYQNGKIDQSEMKMKVEEYMKKIRYSKIHKEITQSVFVITIVITVLTILTSIYGFMNKSTSMITKVSITGIGIQVLVCVFSYLVYAKVRNDNL